MWKVLERRGLRAGCAGRKRVAGQAGARKGIGWHFCCSCCYLLLLLLP